MAELMAVCVVHELRPDAGSVGITAIDKRPVAGPVRVRSLGLYADTQTDRKYHGGEDKALYVYSEEDAAYWEASLGRPLPAGWFGENLRVSGLDVSGAHLGERWRIGDTVVVQVTMPRNPCQTFARWVGGPDEPGWVKRFRAAGRPGAYLRVVTPGSISAGDAIQVVAVPADSPTIARVFAGESALA